MRTVYINTIFFFYIYHISFTFFPLGTRYILGVFGFIWFVILFIQQKKDFTVNVFFFKFLIFLFFIGFISIVSMSYNETLDIEFIKYVITRLIMIFACYFVVKSLIKLNYKLNFYRISSLMINVILIQSIIAFMMFTIPELRDILLSIQRIEPEHLEGISKNADFRIIGFGTMYFGAGSISGFTLILIGILIRFYDFSSKKVLILSLKFLFILTIGMMMARTTFIGGLLGIILIMLPKNLKPTISILKKRVWFIFSIAIIPAIIIAVLFFTIPKVTELLEPTLNFAFEIFINYFKHGSMESVSTNRLQEMYIFPTKIKTWIIGDGYWFDPFGKGYYMHTDVGYLRLIYYFGLVGLAVYLLMQFYIIRVTYKSYNLGIIVYGIVFSYLLILNLKGFADLLLFNMMFLIAYLLNKNNVSIIDSR